MTPRRTRVAERHWDVICVGSGISSLVFAAQLARLRPEQRVLVIEQHYVLGGYASNFRRRALRFDCSLHKLSGVAEGGNLGRVLEELELLPELALVRHENYFQACQGPDELTLPSRYADFKDLLFREFPHEALALTRFFEDLESHGKNGYYQLQILDGSYTPDMRQLRYAHRELKKITARAALRERVGVSDKRLFDILSAPAIYVGGFPEDLSYLYYLHVVYATLVCGSAYVRGTSQSLSDALAARVEQAGGGVLLSTRVEQILVTGSHAYGVRTSRGDYYAPLVYVNAAPHYAVDALLPDTPALAPVRARLGELRSSFATTTLYLVTDSAPESLGLPCAETMLCETDSAYARRRDLRERTRDSEAAQEEAFWRHSAMEVTNYHQLAPENGKVVCLNVLDEARHWPKRDTPEYAAKKQRCENALLERLYAAKPAFRGRVVYLELASPRTYERYTNNPGGAGYGALVGTDTVPFTFHYGFPIEGVQFLSAWVAGPGYEAAFGYGSMRARTFEPSARLRAPGAALALKTGVSL